MSWNEPGNNRKDPWSGRDDQESPPELDKVFQGVKEKLSGIFGQGSGKPADGRWVGLIAGVLVVGWTFTGFYIIDEGNRGVEQRFGAYTETTQPGLNWHFPFPIEAVSVVSVEQQKFIEVGYRSSGRQQALGAVPKEALMLTQDENIVDLRLAVQYQIKNARDYLFNVFEPDATLKQVTESVLRGVIGKNTMDFVLTEGRSEIVDAAKMEIQKILDEYQSGIRIITVNLVDAQPPEEVQNAFEDAIKAREDEQRLKNEAESYANEVVPKARGAGARVTQEAEAYKQRVIAQAAGEAARFNKMLAEYQKAPEVTRKRLYLETIEAVLGAADTTFLDVKSGNNVIYLPIDRPTPMSAPTESTGVSEHSSAMPAASSPQVQTRPVRSSGRGREGRS